MIKHIAMWKIKDMAEGRTKSKNADILRMNINALKFVITQITSIDSGPNLAPNEEGYDFALVATFKNEEAFEACKEHPEYKIVSDLIERVVVPDSEFVFDYKIKK